MVNHMYLSIGVPGRCDFKSRYDFQNHLVAAMPSICRQITLMSMPQHTINATL